MLTTKRIHLLTNPRNLSTALMYSFAQRSDTTIVDEPLYGYYLKESGANHPGRDEIINEMNTDGKTVIRNMATQNFNQPVVFFKGMAHHIFGFEYEHLLAFTNIIYIRNPYQTIASFAKVVDNPTIETIGILPQIRIFQFLKEKGKIPIILDSGKLLENPPVILEKLCNKLEIPFEENMLSWKAGARPEDGIWAKYWYANVHKSTGFVKQKTSSRVLPKRLEPLYKACLPYYEELLEYAI